MKFCCLKIVAVEKRRKEKKNKRVTFNKLRETDRRTRRRSREGSYIERKTGMNG